MGSSPVIGVSPGSGRWLRPPASRPAERPHGGWKADVLSVIRSRMLFTPKKYGRDWTFFLAITFYAASLGFGIATVAAGFSHFDDLSDKVFSVVGFFVGTIVWGALGKSYWNMASGMGDRPRR
jgi:hypothetical protein